MAQKIYKGLCVDCGKYTEKKTDRRSDLRCPSCGIEAARRAAIEMSTKSGPAWDSFVRSRGASGRPPKQQRK